MKNYSSQKCWLRYERNRTERGGKNPLNTAVRRLKSMSQNTQTDMTVFLDTWKLSWSLCLWCSSPSTYSPQTALFSIALFKCTYKSTLWEMSSMHIEEHCLWMVNSDLRLFNWPQTFHIKATKGSGVFIQYLKSKIIDLLRQLIFSFKSNKLLRYIFSSYLPNLMFSDSLDFLWKFRGVLEIYYKHITLKSGKDLCQKKLLKLNSANKMQDQSTSLVGLLVALFLLNQEKLDLEIRIYYLLPAWLHQVMEDAFDLYSAFIRITFLSSKQ